jgi:hypothetical protein
MEITARITELTDAATQREIDAVMGKLHAEGWTGDEPLTKADLAVTMQYAKKARALPRYRTRPFFRRLRACCVHLAPRGTHDARCDRTCDPKP